MGKPSTRIGDNHACPMTDGPKPHVGGVVLPPGTVTVLIGGLPAATMGDPVLCVSPIPNSIVLGSLGVFIGGRPAARMFDKTLHGGTIMRGDPTVLIGDVSGVAGPAIFPGVQKYGNCGVQCSQQLVRQLTGTVHEEDALLDLAIAAGLAHDGYDPEIKAVTPLHRGGTSVVKRQLLLAAHGVPSTLVGQPTAADLGDALKDGKGVIAAVDAGQLQKGLADGGGHVVLVYDGDFDGDGNLTHVYLNDTGVADPDLCRGRCVPIAEMMASLDNYKHARTRRPMACLNVTAAPLWTSTPIDLNPPRLSGTPKPYGY